MLTIILAVLICAPFLWWISLLVRYKDVFRFPGPRPLPVVGNVIDIGNTPQQFLKNLLKFQRKYKEPYRLFIGNDVRMILSSPELMEQVMSSNAHITKSNTYDLLTSWLGYGLLISTGTKWKSRRKLITPTFHFKILDQFLETFNSCGNILVDKLAQEVGKPRFDVYPYINLYSLDVICETSMGAKVQAQEGKNIEYVQAVRGMLDIFITRTFSTWQRFDSLFSLSDMYAPYKEYLRILHQFTNNVIVKRRKEKSQQNSKSTNSVDDVGIKRKVALLETLLESEDNNRLSNEDIREEIDTFMFEGHDTTASGISFAILALAENPEIQEKVYEEIVSVIGDEENITMHHLQEVKYLEMVIKEVQRIYPSVPAIERLLETDATFDDCKYPKGIFITLFIYGLHHDERYFPDPEKFDPDRFLAENQAQRHNYAYVPFSAGARNCIGQKFAMLEMKSVIVKILRSFKIHSVPNYKPELGMAAVLKSYNGVCVRLESRNAR